MLLPTQHCQFASALPHKTNTEWVQVSVYFQGKVDRVHQLLHTGTDFAKLQHAAATHCASKVREQEHAPRHLQRNEEATSQVLDGHSKHFGARKDHKLIYIRSSPLFRF